MKAIIYLILIVYLHLLPKPILSVTDNWPPYIDSTSTNGGFLLQLVRASFKEEGKKVDHIVTPWVRTLNKVRTGEADICINAWFTEDRSDEFYFSKPYFENRVVFIKRFDDPFEYNNIESLKGKTIGTIRDYAYSEQFDNYQHFKRSSAIYLEQNIGKLLMNRIDMFIEVQLVVNSAISLLDSTYQLQLSFVRKPFSSKKLYVISSRKSEENREIVEKFNRGLIKIVENGIYFEILDRNGILYNEKDLLQFLK